MDQAQQRKYWRDKQRESRERRRLRAANKNAPATLPARVLPSLQAPPAIVGNVRCKVSVEEIAALPYPQRTAFMLGVSEVIGVLEQPST